MVDKKKGTGTNAIKLSRNLFVQQGLAQYGNLMAFVPVPFLFAIADLVRHFEFKVVCDFVRLSSYGTRSYSSDDVVVESLLRADCNDRHVIIVEDIVDTGNTIDWLYNRIDCLNLMRMGVGTPTPNLWSRSGYTGVGVPTLATVFCRTDRNVCATPIFSLDKALLGFWRPFALRLDLAAGIR